MNLVSEESFQKEHEHDIQNGDTTHYIPECFTVRGSIYP